MAPVLKVVLRLPASPDAPSLSDVFGDPLTRLWNAGPDPADVAAWISDQAAFGTDSRTWIVADTDTDGDRVLGTVSLFSIDRDQGTALIGYRTVPGERGRGVATAAVRAASAEAFAVLGLHRIQLYHAVANGASCTVAQRAGFALEGTLRESYRYGDGVFHDEHLHARLRTDPTDTGPIDTDTDPTDTDPTDTDPIDTDPIDTGPIDTDGRPVPAEDVE